MQCLEVSVAIRHIYIYIYIYVIRLLKFKIEKVFLKSKKILWMILIATHRVAMSTPNIQNRTKIWSPCLPTNGWAVKTLLGVWRFDSENVCVFCNFHGSSYRSVTMMGFLSCYKLYKREMVVQCGQNTAGWTFAVGKSFDLHMFGQRVLFCTSDLVCCTPIPKFCAERTRKLLTKFETVLQFPHLTL